MRRAGKAQRGFTLVELVVGMVVSAIALTLLYSLIYPQLKRSVDPILQVRAAELGQAVIEEVFSKGYDELSPVGGVPPCNPCTSTANMGVDSGEASRALFDDVDDFNLYCGSSHPIEDILGTVLNGFANFRMETCVVYDGDYDGAADGNQTAKRITVAIYAPQSGGGMAAPIIFTAYRGNF